MKVISILLLLFFVSCNSEDAEESGRDTVQIPAEYMQSFENLCSTLPVSQSVINDCVDDKLKHTERLYYRDGDLYQAYQDVYDALEDVALAHTVIISDVVYLKNI